jgi:hypothetical protein
MDDARIRHYHVTESAAVPEPLALSFDAGPPRATLIRWLRLNLAMTLSMVGVICTLAGGLITATWRVSRYDQRLEAIEHQQTDNAPTIARIGPIDVSIADINNRMRALEIDRAERDKKWSDLREELGKMHGHSDVVDDKLLFVGKFIDLNTMPILHPTQIKGYHP